MRASTTDPVSPVSDPIFLQRFERDAVIACALSALVGLLVWGWAAAGSVAAGGLLALVSYRALKGAVLALVSGGSGTAWTLVKFFTRHAILAFAAYVMLSRLRVSPVGLIAGVSAPVAALGAAACRIIIPARRPGNPR